MVGVSSAAALFFSSDHTLNTLDPEYSSKWRKYLQLKQQFYMAYVGSHRCLRHYFVGKRALFGKSPTFILSAGVLLSWTDSAGQRQVWRGHSIAAGGRKVCVCSGCYLIYLEKWNLISQFLCGRMSFCIFLLFFRPDRCLLSCKRSLLCESAAFSFCLGYSRAEALCKEYRHTSGPGSTAKPSEQLFFLKLGALIKNTLEKCQRENGFMWVGLAWKTKRLLPLPFHLLLWFLRYFHKVPAEAPQLELKASYGLAEPVGFEMPPLSEQCTPEVYATFDLTKGAKNDKVKTIAKKFKTFNTNPEKGLWLFTKRDLKNTSGEVNSFQFLHHVLLFSFILKIRANLRKRRWSRWRSPTWSHRRTRAVSSPKHSSPFPTSTAVSNPPPMCSPRIPFTHAVLLFLVLSIDDVMHSC